ncbi:hypothetical protein LIER_00624 [Lithospermum erythrorhizon]|uniref:RNase H type-1 domain-containing protein n=1 Tax=Lithospermum erythrorhizon TaxID=34254 RepID=A0AAV3NJ64_LITER
MEPPNTYKEVLRLVGRLVALRKFISRSGDRSLPFFKKIRQASKKPFEWDEECTKAFSELQDYLGLPKLLTRPEGAVSGPRDVDTSEIPPWKLYVDEAINEKEAGAGILIKGPNGEVFEYTLRFSFKATNNEAEYETMVTWLEIAQALEIKRLLVQGDSKIIIDQIRGDGGVKNENLGKYHVKALSLLPGFDYVIFAHIPQEQNGMPTTCLVWP